MKIKTREWIRKPIAYNTFSVIEFVLQYLYEFRAVILNTSARCTASFHKRMDT